MSDPFHPIPQKYFAKLPYINNELLFGFETSHIMVLYFVVQGLASNQSIELIDKQQIIQYVKSLQLQNGGFGPSSLYMIKGSLPHIVFTYSAVNILKILNSINIINKEKCLSSVKRCQRDNGSFSNFQNSNQADLRFVYAAVAICSAFQDFSYINKEKIVQYLNSCSNYDGGYGLKPFCQSHSGAIYCALATYKMVGTNPPNSLLTLQFLTNRQAENQDKNIVGIQGRVGKMPDSCYSFWIGASIKILTGQNLLNEKIENFLRLCYNEADFNFSKYPVMKGDPLHTLHSSTGLKIIKQQDSKINILQGTTNLVSH